MKDKDFLRLDEQDILKKQGSNKTKNTIKLISIVTIILLIGIFAYGYLEGIDLLPYRKQNLGTRSARLELTYTDCASNKKEDCAEINAGLEPGESVTKTFEVKNTGTASLYYSLYFQEMKNTFKNDELVYKIERDDGTEVIPETPMPYFETVQQSYLVKGDIPIERGELHTYRLTITFLDKDYNQEENLDAEFSLKLGIEERDMFTVSFNPNGGSVSIPSKNVKYDEVYGELPRATKLNSVFVGWFTEKEGGTQVTEDTIASHRDSSVLYAHWSGWVQYAVAEIQEDRVPSNGGILKHNEFDFISPYLYIRENFYDLNVLYNREESPFAYEDGKYSNSKSFNYGYGNHYSVIELSITKEVETPLVLCYEYNSDNNTYAGKTIIARFYLNGVAVHEINMTTSKCFSIGNITTSDVIKVQFGKLGGGTTYEGDSEWTDYWSPSYSLANVSLSFNIKTALATNSSGIFTMSEDNGDSYYFRGDIDYNYVKLGKNKDGKDMWWRVIRVNPNGTVRMIYDGTEAHKNGESSDDRFAILSSPYSTDDKGFSTLNSWLSGNNTVFSDNSDIKLESLLSEEDFSLKTCGQYINSNGAVQVGLAPKFYCSSGTTRKSKIGLISSDEVIAAGAMPRVSNNGYYLYKGGFYWTGSRNPYQSGTNRTHFVDYDGSLHSAQAIDSSKFHYAPVINVRADVALKFKGIGTVDDPYRLESASDL